MKKAPGVLFVRTYSITLSDCIFISHVSILSGVVSGIQLENLLMNVLELN